MDSIKKLVLKFVEFINESESYDFEIDQRFPWSEKINNLINSIMEKRNYLIKEFEYDRHKGDGFEFDIKARAYPDIDYLKKEYGYTEEEIYEMWDQFLADNLQMEGDDIVENSAYFSDWYTTGRSGGWLLLKHKSNLINDPDSVIEDDLVYLNDLTDEVTEEEYNEWKEFYENDSETKKGSSLLKSFEIEVGDFQNINDAEEESKSVISNLEEHLTKLQDVEKELNQVGERIKSFWKDAEVNFNDYVQSENEWRGSN